MNKAPSMRSTKMIEEQPPPKSLVETYFNRGHKRFMSSLSGEESELNLMTRGALDKFNEGKVRYSTALKASEVVIHKYETHDLKEFTHISSETQQLSLRAKKVRKIK